MSQNRRGISPILFHSSSVFPQQSVIYNFRLNNIPSYNLFLARPVVLTNTTEFQKEKQMLIILVNWYNWLPKINEIKSKFSNKMLSDKLNVSLFSRNDILSESWRYFLYYQHGLRLFQNFKCVQTFRMKQIQTVFIVCFKYLTSEFFYFASQ